MAQSKKPKQGKRTSDFSPDNLVGCLVVGLILIALGLLILISAFTKLDGGIFDILRQLSSGLAGTMAFGLAVIPAWGGILFLISTQRRAPLRPFILACVLLLLIFTAVTLLTYISAGVPLMEAVRTSVTNDGISPDSYGAYLSDAYEFGNGSRRNDHLPIGGGLLGMLLAWPLWKGFGAIGGGVVAIVLALVVFLFLIRLDARGISSNLRQTSAQNAARREEKRALRQQEALVRQQQQQQEALARQQQEAMARQQQEAFARQQQEALARQQQEAFARQQQEAFARQQQAAFARQQQEAMARQQQQAMGAPAHMPADVPDPWQSAPSQGVPNWDENRVRPQDSAPPQPGKRSANPKQSRKPIGFQPEPEQPNNFVPPVDMPPVTEHKGLFQRKHSNREEPETESAPRRRSPFSRTNAAEETVAGEVTGPSRRAGARKTPAASADPFDPMQSAPVTEAPASDAAPEAQEPAMPRVKVPTFPARTSVTEPQAPVAPPESKPRMPSGMPQEQAQPEAPAKAVREGSFMARMQARQAARDAAANGEGSGAPARSTRKDTPSAWSDPDAEAGNASWRGDAPAPARPAPRSRASAARQDAEVNAPVQPASSSDWSDMPPWEEAPAQPEAPQETLMPQLRRKTTQLPDGVMMQTQEEQPYIFPSLDLLAHPQPQVGISQEEDEVRSRILENTLQSFKVPAKVRNITHGPAISRFELELAPGVRVSKVTDLNRNIAMNLEVKSVRIEAPIPGKSLVGVEVPNHERAKVTLREVLQSNQMMNATKPLIVALGKDIAGTPIVCDLAKMPHLLIAGATGSGKSVCINTIINSLIYRCSPKDVRLILVDPKVVELQCYNGIPHLLVPVVSDPHKASGALAWAVGEMMDRYNRFQDAGVRAIDGYNEKMPPEEQMPRIVIVIDELADLMMTCKKDVEERICRLAQLARAAGIHLIVATQRPSVDVITGLIKANIPSRIAFKVTSNVDSRTILDRPGAEQLLGYGDMLYMPTGEYTPIRVQGCFLSDDEVNRITEFIRKTCPGTYDPEILEALDKLQTEGDAINLPDPSSSDDDYTGGDGSLLMQAIEMAVNDGQVSTSLIQRRLRLGYARAGRLVDEMERRGIVSQKDGAKPRLCLISREEFEIMKDSGQLD